MTKHRGLFLTLALSALISLMAGEARAGSISIDLDLGGGTHVLVDTFRTGGTATDYGTVNLALLNAALAAKGSAYEFSAIGGQSNFPGSAVQGQLSVSGGIEIVPGAGGANTFLKLTETESGFTAPTGLSGTLSSSSTGNFTNEVAGGGHTASSSFNLTDTPTYSVLSSGLPVNPQGGMSSTGVAPVATLYELNNVATFGLTKQVGLNVVDSFGVTATITAVTVPEPASLVTMLMGIPLPLVFWCLLRRHRRAVA